MLLRRLVSFSAVCCALSFAACDDETPAPEAYQLSFNSFGLDGKIVNELDLVNNMLYASTNTGVFAKDLTANTDWFALGLAQKNVKTFTYLNNNLLLAATANPSTEEYLLFQSTDGGQSWQETTTNWGGGAPEPLNDMYLDPETQTLYGSGANVVARSEDGGNNWTKVFGEWQSMASGLAFVALNPKNKELWTGGQNAIEGFMLHRQNAGGGSWQSWQTLLASPSVAKSIAFSSSNPQVILVGGEDGIIKTTNNGSSWSTVKHDDNARFYFGLDFDHQVQDRVYAASWVKNFDDPQALVLHISDDAGNNWKEFKHAPASLFGGAWSMVQKSEGNKTILYLGLYKGGVYEVVITEPTSAPTLELH